LARKHVTIAPAATAYALGMGGITMDTLLLSLAVNTAIILPIVMLGIITQR
jgi:hypothetical protein